MASSKMEFYKKNRNGKINIDWHGQINGGKEVLYQAYKTLKLIDKALIVAKFTPGTGNTCLRIIINITRKAKLLGVETRVILPKEEQFDVAEATGFTRFYEIFLTELEALEDLDIIDFYPLTLINLTEFNPNSVTA